MFDWIKGKLPGFKDRSPVIGKDQESFGNDQESFGKAVPLGVKKVIPKNQESFPKNQESAPKKSNPDLGKYILVPGPYSFRVRENRTGQPSVGSIPWRISNSFCRDPEAPTDDEIEYMLANKDQFK